jgi:hypothetical protein
VLRLRVVFAYLCACVCVCVCVCVCTCVMCLWRWRLWVCFFRPPRMPRTPRCYCTLLDLLFTLGVHCLNRLPHRSRAQRSFVNSFCLSPLWR